MYGGGYGDPPGLVAGGPLVAGGELLVWVSFCCAAMSQRHLSGRRHLADPSASSARSEGPKEHGKHDRGPVEAMVLQHRRTKMP